MDIFVEGKRKLRENHQGCPLKGKSAEAKGRKLIFLDRDGVINKDPGNSDYVKKWSEFSFLPRSIKALKRLTDERYEIIIISNQAGVNKGLYSERDLEKITENMLKKIEKSGTRIKRVYYCIHRDEDNCNCRKPKTGLFDRAMSELETSNSEIQTPIYFIGDGLADIEAGKNAGYKTILVLSGKSSTEDVKNCQLKPDYVAKDLWEAVTTVLRSPFTKAGPVTRSPSMLQALRKKLQRHRARPCAHPKGFRPRATRFVRVSPRTLTTNANNYL